MKMKFLCFERAVNILKWNTFMRFVSLSYCRGLFVTLITCQTPAAPPQTTGPYFYLTCINLKCTCWNDNIKWQTLDDALAESEQTKKPVMLVIHKSWCGACKALKPKFAESDKIEELSSNFHMVNTIDDDEPKDAKYSPDGGYIPRILFIHEGKVRDELYHEGGNAKYKFYYHSPDGIIKTMERAIQTFDLKQSSHSTDEL